MAARRACRSLSQGLQLGVSRGVTMLPIKGSCSMSGDRSSRGTGSGLSKWAEPIRSGDESGNTARCDSPRASRSNPHWLTSRPDCRRFRSFNGAWRHAAGKSMRGDRPLPWRSQRWPRTASLPKPKQHQTANSRLGPHRTDSLACRQGCSLAYFQPCRVRPGRFPGVPFEASSSRRQAKTLSRHRRCIDLVSQVPHVCLEWH